MTETKYFILHKMVQQIYLVQLGKGTAAAVVLGQISPEQQTRSFRRGGKTIQTDFTPTLNSTGPLFVYTPI